MSHEQQVLDRRITQFRQALSACRVVLADYQRQHEAAERSWAKVCHALQARAEFLEARVRAYDAFQLPGADEVLRMSTHLATVRAPDPTDAQTFTARLNTILESSTGI